MERKRYKTKKENIIKLTAFYEKVNKEHNKLKRDGERNIQS